VPDIYTNVPKTVTSGMSLLYCQNIHYCKTSEVAALYLRYICAVHKNFDRIILIHSSQKQLPYFMFYNPKFLMIL